MEEYDAMFDSMLHGHSSPRTPRSPSPRGSPTYSSKRRHTRSRNPSPGSRSRSRSRSRSPPKSNDDGSPKSGGSIRHRGTKRMQKHRRVKRRHRTRK